jgi:hypothetical protein
LLNNWNLSQIKLTNTLYQNRSDLSIGFYCLTEIGDVSDTHGVVGVVSLRQRSKMQHVAIPNSSRGHITATFWRGYYQIIKAVTIKIVAAHGC